MLSGTAVAHALRMHATSHMQDACTGSRRDVLATRAPHDTFPTVRFRYYACGCVQRTGLPLLPAYARARSLRNAARNAAFTHISWRARWRTARANDLVYRGTRRRRCSQSLSDGEFSATQHRACDGDHVFNRESVVRHYHWPRRRGTEAVHTDDGALLPHVSFPAEG